MRNNIYPVTAVVRDFDESDRQHVESFLSIIGVPIETSNDSLRPLIGGNKRKRRIILYGNTKIIGFVSWDNFQQSIRQAFFFSDETHPYAARVIDSGLSELLSCLPIRKPIRLNLSILAGQIFCRETARLHGYQENSTDTTKKLIVLSKIAYHGFLAKDQWPLFIDDFSKLTGYSFINRFPKLNELKNTGIKLIDAEKRSVHLKLFEFETYFSPVILLPSDRTSVIVPIKLSYAESLLTLQCPQLLLWPKPEAALYLERVYFRSPYGAKVIDKGDLIFFYVSGSNTIGKEVVATARVTSSVIITTDQAVLEYSRQGVIDISQLDRMANEMKQIHAFTFDNISIFTSPISLLTLRKKKIISKQTLIRPFRLNSEKTRKLLCLAFSRG